MIGFFTLHFGMFHFVHSIFLNGFFPLVDDPSNFFLNGVLFIKICLTRYWAVNLLSAVSQLRNIQQAATAGASAFPMSPYKNVIKMHISIFVFAGLSMAGVADLILPYLMLLYFFPFEAMVA